MTLRSTNIQATKILKLAESLLGPEFKNIKQRKLTHSNFLHVDAARLHMNAARLHMKVNVCKATVLSKMQPGT